MAPRHYKLDELAKAAGVSPRTVRYYVQRGLLPPPVFRGPDTSYDADHLARLQKIKALQERHLPLDEIQAILDGGAEVPPPPPVPQMPHVRAPRTSLASAWERITLAPGLELHVEIAASRAVRELAEALRTFVETQQGASK